MYALLRISNYEQLSYVVFFTLEPVSPLSKSPSVASII